MIIIPVSTSDEVENLIPLAFMMANYSLCFSGEKLEFSGQGDVNPRELGEEIERKREQYQNILQPFYRQCKRNEVGEDTYSIFNGGIIMKYAIMCR